MAENSTTRKLTVVTCSDNDEAVYIDGTYNTHDSTIYACDIATISGGRPVIVDHIGIEFTHDKWPETLNGALVQPLKIADGV